MNFVRKIPTCDTKCKTFLCCVKIIPTSVGTIPKFVGTILTLVGIIPTCVGTIPKFVGTILTLVGIIPTCVGIIPTLQEDVLHFAQCVGIFLTKFNSVGTFPTKILQKFSIKLYTCRNHVPTQV